MRDRDNLDLIFNVAELARLFERSGSLHDFLHEVVVTVAHHLHVPVSTVYLYDETLRELVLAATVGLHVPTGKEIRLKLGEGISGTALKEMRPILEAAGTDNPSFKFIPGIDEERYQSFLAVPILRGFSRVGVLTIQHSRRGYFGPTDRKALMAIASQLASIIENTRLLMHIERTSTEISSVAPPPEAMPEFIKGSPGAPGYGRGLATVIEMGVHDYLERLVEDGERMALTCADFDSALKDSADQIQELELELEQRLSDVSASLIFGAHQLMLKDEEFSGRIRRDIESGAHPARAVHSVVLEYVRLFSQQGSQLMREKAQDVLDLGHRLLANMTGQHPTREEYRGRVVILRDVLPSGIVKLAAQGASGVLLLRGSMTAHVAILARSLDVPLAIAPDERLLSLEEDVEILIDGELGNIFLNPSAEVISRYDEIIAAQAASDGTEHLCELTHTADGCRITLMANVNLLGDIGLVKRFKAEGVGLYRSEFPFVIRKEFPSEEEQYRIYRRLVTELPGQELVLRTLDIGGDKMLSYFPNDAEANPFMGLRAIRFSLRHPSIFAQQLRAMLRAGHGVGLQIMFPLISSVDDFVAARRIVMECCTQLEEQGVPHCHSDNLRIGAMVEVPSAVEVIDLLAEEADFLSIGSNDLIQYLLAVDRTNKQLSSLYLPHHPAVLRAIKRVVDAATKSSTPLSMCGLMACEPRLLPFLIGVGFRRLSFDARKIPTIQKVISRLCTTRTKEIADTMLSMGMISDVSAYLDEVSEELNLQG